MPLLFAHKEASHVGLEGDATRQPCSRRRLDPRMEAR